MSELHVSTRVLGLLLLFGWLSFLSIAPLSNLIDDHTTPQPWFAVDFSVPDHQVGDDPVVLYDRFPQRFVEGTWFVNVYRSTDDGQSFVCNGSAPGSYNPLRPTRLPIRLSDFIGNQACPWQPGEHVACAEYVLRDPARDVTRTFGPFCREFRVMASAPDQP